VLDVVLLEVEVLNVLEGLGDPPILAKRVDEPFRAAPWARPTEVAATIAVVATAPTTRTGTSISPR